MDAGSYFADIMGGIDFLMALGSLIGFFGTILGAAMLVVGGRQYKSKGLKVLLVGITLLVLFGYQTGIKYFRL